MSGLIKKNSKVSIIVPLYNTKNLLAETIESVLSQTYTNWEMIIVDDCSTDGSYEYAMTFSEKEQRIKVFQLSCNSGPGEARKYGYEKAEGEIIAFLDSDDLWMPVKLERQITFMADHQYEFTCTDYEQINEKGSCIGRTIYCKEQADYRSVLRTCPVGSSTVMITSDLLGKVDMPTIRKSNDYSLWLRILKIYPYVYGIQETLMLYRIRPQSISYNKFKKVKYSWRVFREYEGFSVMFSLFLILEWAFIKIMKIK